MSESDHWYMKDGTPCHGIGMREARKLGAIPSVSAIKSIPENVGIRIWERNLICDEAKCYSPWALNEEIIREALSVKEDAAKWGSEFHGRVHHLLTSGDAPYSEHDVIVAAAENAVDEVGTWGTPDKLLSETTFAAKVGDLWFGGTRDLVVYIDKQIILADFKTRTNKESMKVRDQDWLQLAAYEESIPMEERFENAIEWVIMLVNRETGEVVSRRMPEEKRNYYRTRFMLLLAYWHITHKWTEPSSMYAFAYHFLEMIRSRE